MTELIIYLIGYIWSYYLWRKILREAQKDSYSWSDIFTASIFSIASYGSVIAILFSNWAENDDIKEIKPPKFL